ncbi:MAG: BON domain-containing protein [Pseudomonadota bacterium]
MGTAQRGRAATHYGPTRGRGQALAGRAEACVTVMPRRLEKPILATIVLVWVLGLAGCTAMLLGDGARSSSPPGSAATNDIQLAREVWQAFAAARLPERSELQVTARSGVVTLSGRASSPTVRAQAERLAFGVPGVRRVVNNIQ